MIDYVYGVITGVSLLFIAYPVVYHFGWCAGFDRHKRISNGGY